MAYWVVGGEYTDTRFETIVPGSTLEKIGPFETYQDAYRAWSGRAWATVDNCQCRFQVVEGDGQIAA
jgi:hypothetical protein